MRTPQPFSSFTWRVTPARSFGLFVLLAGLMLVVRLYWLRDQFISLSYGVPLLVCVAYRSRTLLWSLAIAFALMSISKSALLRSREIVDSTDAMLNWGMHVLNLIIVGMTVHWVANLIEALGARNRELIQSNEKLAARDDEISRQNEELQAQTEELAQQNEEIQQQAEELRQQSEELQTQTDQLHAANEELGKRQHLLENLLQSVQTAESGEGAGGICASLLELFQGSAVALAVLQREGDQVRVTAHAGAPGITRSVIPYTQSFAAFSIEHNRAAALADLQLRPDIQVPQPAGCSVRSVLAAPLRLVNRVVGTVEVYSETPREWTQEQFRILEWAAAQCSLMMEARHLHDELVATNARLDGVVKERTAELQEMVNELEHFSYTITHDLRAPLRAMHGYAGMLTENLSDGLDPENQEYLRRIGTAAVRMDRLITDALSYSKAVRQEFTMAVVDPIPLLRGMIESYPVFQPPRATVEVASDIPRVLGNEAGLTQCFSNLLENAVKFVPKDRVPLVRVRAEVRDKAVRLWFVDNGIGIPSEMQSRVFVMFQRLNKEYDGTGIGLALVRKVTERMGGKVGVESDGTGGSRFWIELRAAEYPRLS